MNFFYECENNFHEKKTELILLQTKNYRVYLQRFKFMLQLTKFNKTVIRLWCEIIYLWLWL